MATIPSNIADIRPLLPLLLSIEDTAEALGIGLTKTFEILKEGEIETVSIGRRRQVVYASLVAYVDRLRARQNNVEAA